MQYKTVFEMTNSFMSHFAYVYDKVELSKHIVNQYCRHISICKSEVPTLEISNYSKLLEIPNRLLYFH